MLANEIASGIVFLSWIVFAVGFLLRRKKPRQIERSRESTAMFGLLLAAVGYALVFSVRREFPSVFLPLGIFVELISATVSTVLAVGSVYLALAAIDKLGKQWTPAARIIESHELITTGPYRIVRHPIYTAMLGLMIATGIVIAQPLALAIAIGFYVLGTLLRIKTEERLLLQYFGKQYEEYRSKVPALIPYLY